MPPTAEFAAQSPARGDRRPSPAFRRAPQSLAGFVAAVLEPGLCALMLVAVHVAWDEPFERHSMVLLLLTLTLTFPGTARFRDPALASAAAIGLNWLWLVALLLVCGYATASLDLFPPAMMATWAAGTALLHWGVVFAGGRWLRRRAAREGERRRAVVVGAVPLGVRAAQAIAARDDVRTRIVGFFDDRAGERLAPGRAAPLLGGLAAVEEFVQRQAINEVYVTLPLGSQPRIVALLESLQDTTASVHYVPDVQGVRVIQGRLQDVNGVVLVGLCETPFTGVNAAAKRASDLVIASLLLVLMAPLLVAIALGVKLSSPGPAIFRQRRNGLGGEEIVVYKFSTMRTMEDGDVVRQARRDDERITRFGAFLRRTSLDELPQFINVLQGHMSIVGPRPHAVAHNELYRRLISGYMLRHKAKPGITGWAQVNGLRGETDTVDKMAARIRLDLDYLLNWSLSLDLMIILKTVWLVFKDARAY